MEAGMQKRGVTGILSRLANLDTNDPAGTKHDAISLPLRNVGLRISGTH